MECGAIPMRGAFLLEAAESSHRIRRRGAARAKGGTVPAQQMEEPGMDEPGFSPLGAAAMSSLANQTPLHV
jgi:hypothetical protein